MLGRALCGWFGCKPICRRGWVSEMFLPLKMVHGVGESSSNFDIWLEVWSDLTWVLKKIFIYGWIRGVEKFGFRIVYNFCSKLKAKLSFVLKDGIWCWRSACSKDLVEIQTKLPKVHMGIVDSPVWTISRSGIYVSVDTWNYFRIKRSCVN